MSQNRYWECTNCEQVVQGFNAMEQIDCCANKNMVEITDEVEAERAEREEYATEHGFQR